MTAVPLLSILQAVAGELRILITLIAKPGMTPEQIADQLGLSPKFVTTVLPAMCRKNIITYRVRMVGYQKFEDIYLPHPGLNFDAIAAQYPRPALPDRILLAASGEVTNG